MVFGGYAYFELSSTTVFVHPNGTPPLVTWPKPLDIAEYNERMLALAHYVPEAVATSTATTSAPSLIYGSTTNVTVEGSLWPAPAVLPHGEAILPFHRIIAYYGNFYSTRMGILGELEPEAVLAQLASTTAAWTKADPSTPALPAIHYIAMVAQGEAGRDGMYRSVMPDEEVEKAYQMAKDIDGILFIDLQIGLSDIEVELPKFREFLTRPDVHLAIDPEFAMADGNRPGTVIGRYEAEEINYVIEYLADIVREYQLPPKVLIVHRFTTPMVQNVEQIIPRPEVQVVIHMDGWGPRALKRNTYYHVVETEPLQFAGLKIFYKNDLKPPSTGIFTPEEALELYPRPIYIQYQ